MIVQKSEESPKTSRPNAGKEITAFKIKFLRYLCLKSMNSVIFALSGYPRIGLISESKIVILQKTSMTCN